MGLTKRTICVQIMSGTIIPTCKLINSIFFI